MENDRLYIKGKVRHFIFESDSGYKVGIIRIKETNDQEMDDFVGKTVTFNGTFANLNLNDNYIFYGNLVYTDKYGYQYKVVDYEHQEVVGKDAVIEFLTSDLVKGCGKQTAQKIVDTLGDDAILKIKEDYHCLLVIPKLTEAKALKIYDSIVAFQNTDDLIIKLREYGFIMSDILNIINKYGDKSLNLVEQNPYALTDIIDFNELDKIYINMGIPNSLTRLKACLLETFKRLEINNGDTYFYYEELLDGLKRFFNLIPEVDEIDEIIEDFLMMGEVVKEEQRYYLAKTYDMEATIAKRLFEINSRYIKDSTTLDEELIKLEEKINVTYNDDQKNAIKNALKNRVTIITGGPGTGKTTIIKAITELYKKINNIGPKDIANEIALLAPTGRAAKKLAESTGLGASTIHRYLKWNKENDEFQINEFNKNYHKLIIVDETSMIDTFLFYSLLQGITTNIQLILVGDAFQLPSVGPGLILNDMINSDLFTFCPLNIIYRQSNNSYIPYLAKEIKNKDISEDFMAKKDDYNFLSVPTENIKNTIKKICEMSISKGLTDKDIQVLIPMYKGQAGIDNINVILQELFNPKSDNKKEIKSGDLIYRVGDKVLQLVNDPDNSVFNGDIGYISNIAVVDKTKKTECLIIDFDGNKVTYKKEDLIKIKHAYAMTIHKSQGSEFPHVIMPICKSYYRMLYNKLIYTGVSRAKKSLVILGEEQAFLMGINNDYSSNRKTTLTKKLLNNI